MMIKPEKGRCFAINMLPDPEISHEQDPVLVSFLLDAMREDKEVDAIATLYAQGLTTEDVKTAWHQAIESAAQKKSAAASSLLMGFFTLLAGLAFKLITPYHLYTTAVDIITWCVIGIGLLKMIHASFKRSEMKRALRKTLIIPASQITE